MLAAAKRIYHLCIAVASAIYFGFPGRKLTVIGVTGTDGKTTTTTLIYRILKEAGYKTSMITSVHAVIGGKSYDTGFHVTTPTAFWVQKYLAEAVKNGDTHMVLEVTSHGIAQYRVWGIPFAIGVLTNVTHEHLDWHKTFDNYLFTKLRLLTNSRVAVVNRDEAEVFARIVPYLRDKKLITYGIRREAKVTPVSYPFKTSLPGEFNKYNCLAALAVADELGIPRKTATKAIAGFQGVAGRMETVTKKPFTVIVDFAHTPNAVDRALKTVRAMTKKKLIHVFGSAGLRDATKRPLMGEASARYADIIILTEEDYRTENVNDIIDAIASGIPEGKTVLRIPNRKDALAKAFSLAKPGDLVMLTGKGHEQSLCRGTVEYPWNDVRESKKLLKGSGIQV